MQRWPLTSSVLFLSVALVAEQAGAIRCPPDSVPVGTVCVDKYEASVWSVPDPTTRNRKLVRRIERGTVTGAELTAGGAVQLGCDDNTPPFQFESYNDRDLLETGDWTPLPGTDPPMPGIYAVSIAGVLPSSCITWFQSQQACLLSGKRLLTNAEWQGAAAGTPDPGFADDGATTCVTYCPDETPEETEDNVVCVARTGSRSACKSSWGAFDMVGNVSEWVADWAPGSRSAACGGWYGFSDDFLCTELFGLVRGGAGGNATGAGVFSVWNLTSPAYKDIPGFGFRCGRSPRGD